MIELIVAFCESSIIPVQDESFVAASKNGVVLVNGILVGAASTERCVSRLTWSLRSRRQEGALPWDCSISVSEGKDLMVDSDAGCLMRPVLTRKGLASLPSLMRDLAMQSDAVKWNMTIQSGIVVYIDKQEEANYMVGVDPTKSLYASDGTEYTHFEIRPSAMLGVCASLIPFPDHSQSPRNTYQAAMGKQAIGDARTESSPQNKLCSPTRDPTLSSLCLSITHTHTHTHIHTLCGRWLALSHMSCFSSSLLSQCAGRYAEDHTERFDTFAYALCQPQRPLVCTRYEHILRLKDMPNGVNVICAIAVRSGYNQEDSVILNRASVERGLFQSWKVCTYKEEERLNGSDSEKFENAKGSNASGIRVANYDSTNERGCAAVGSVLQNGDVIIGKTVCTADAEATLKGKRNTVKRDKSTLVKSDGHIVDAVLQSHKEDGTRIVKVRTRQIRIPMVGDKLSSRMGQKGICGRLLDAQDMPYTEDGIVPDILLNPHAIPSRMSE